MPGAGRQFLIRLVTEDRANEALAFYKRHLTEYLWPRTIKDLEDLAGDECLYEVVEVVASGIEIVGLCYVMRGKDPADGSARWEFGGVLMAETCRGLGLASLLGIIALANHLAFDRTRQKLRVIAHVHEYNQLPRGMLQNQLGFSRVGEETPPPEAAPPSMKRNASGQVVGHLFEFDLRRLSYFADVLENFNGSVSGRAGSCPVKIELRLAQELRSQALLALRDLAKG